MDEYDPGQVSSLGTVHRLVAAVAAVTFCALVTAASTPARDAAVDPGTPVNGMVVVQGIARDANTALFDTFCDPVVLSAGRRSRTCGVIPAVRRIFVGAGVFAAKKRIDAAWNALTWRMWVDGRSVGLARFGHSDRWLLDFPPAGGRDVVLREWSIVLVGAKGVHTIRYRTSGPGGVADTTWKFRVAAS